MEKKTAKEIAIAATETTAWTVGGVVRLVLRIILTAVLVTALTVLLFACIFAYYVKTELNPKLKISLSDFALSLSSTIWYTDGNGVNQELQRLESRENRIWVDYENLPQGMEHALVAIEDKRFYEHRGVDWYRTAGAVVQMFFSMSNEFGGSTITQQLIKNRTENRADLVSRKLLEIFQALELEKTYDKWEIIEWYLNTVYFGEGCYGVYTAARTYFGKDVWDLSLAESASIIGITNNPSKYDPFIANTITDKDLKLTMTCREWNKYRQELILKEMYEQGYISFAEYQDAVAEELNFIVPMNEVRSQTVNSFYVELVTDDVVKDLMREYGYSEKAAYDRLYYGGLQIYTCIDMDMQAMLDSFFADRSNLPQPYLPSEQPLQVGMMILDPYNGDIRAMCGAVGEKTVNDAWNYSTDSRRQVGSSIKPLSVYGPALEYGLITQTTMVNDSPNIQLSGTSWYTRNAPNTYDGIISIRYALQQSKNTVAAQIVDKLTPAECYNYMVNRLGFTSLVESDANYAPMAEGALTYGVTVREMAQAYTSFVNEGVMTYARSYSKVTDSNGHIVLNNSPRQITSFSPNTAANMCDMLENAVNYGTGYGAGIQGQHVAGKTGTTSDDYDRYFVGFTPYYVAAVWTGYDNNATMLYERNPAVVIWHTIMEKVHAGLESKAFPQPVIGAPTNIFGSLRMEPVATPTPEPTATPEPAAETAAPDSQEEPEEGGEPVPTPIIPVDTEAETGVEAPPEEQPPAPPPEEPPQQPAVQTPPEPETAPPAPPPQEEPGGLAEAVPVEG